MDIKFILPFLPVWLFLCLTSTANFGQPQKEAKQGEMNGGFQHGDYEGGFYNEPVFYDFLNLKNAIWQYTAPKAAFLFYKTSSHFSLKAFYSNHIFLFSTPGFFQSQNSTQHNLFWLSRLDIFASFFLSKHFFFNVQFYARYYAGENEAGKKDYLASIYNNVAKPAFLEATWLYLNYSIIDSAKLSLRALLGVQPVSYGNDPAPFFSNYVLPESVNGLAVFADTKSLGRFYLIVVDVMDIYQNALYKPYCCSDFPDKNSLIIGNSQTDLLTFRSGFFYETPNLFVKNEPPSKNGSQDQGFHKRLLKFYLLKFYLGTLFTGYGSVQGSTEQAQAGSGFSDQDYLFHYFLGSRFAWKNFRMIAEVSMSNGIDHKAPNIFGYSRDIKTNGLYLRLGAGLLFKKNFYTNVFRLSFMYADGPLNDANGNTQSYGYVASGNHETGGLLVNQAMGFRPYALSLSDGISNNKNQVFYHSSGAAILLFNYSFIFPPLVIDLQCRFYVDSRRNFYGKSILQNPLSYLQSRYIGNEDTISFIYVISPNLQLYLTPAIFIPGPVYFSQQYGMAGLNNQEIMYGFLFGANLWF